MQNGRVRLTDGGNGNDDDQTDPHGDDFENLSRVLV